MANETVRENGIVIYLNVGDEKTFYEAIHEKTGVRESGVVINSMPGFREQTRQKAISVAQERIKEKLKIYRKIKLREKETK